MKIIDIANKLIKDGIKLIPASHDEIEILTKLTPTQKLPIEYVSFLELMGKNTPNGFLRGHSCFIAELPFLKDWTIELLEENKFTQKLSELDFIFWMSQGYQFAFFKLNTNNDPPIYYYREGSGQKNFVKITESFTEFILRIYQKDKYLFNIGTDL